MKVKTLLTVALTTFSVFAQAEQILGSKTVLRTFSEGSAKAGFYTKEGLQECKWGIMYIDLSTEAGKAMFSQVLTAKTAGFKIVRIDYSKTGALCKANGLHIQ